jgi:hypothetical protein
MQGLLKIRLKELCFKKRRMANWIKAIANDVKEKNKRRRAGAGVGSPMGRESKSKMPPGTSAGAKQ